MRTAARITLAIVVLLTAMLFVPGRAARVWVQAAIAQVPQPTPTIPDLLPKPSPSPSDTGSGGGGGGGGGSSEEEEEESKRDGKQRDSDGGKAQDRRGGKNERGEGDRGRARGKKGKKAMKRNKRSPAPSRFAPRIPGSYNTDNLLEVAARLRALGLSEEQVVNKAFPPFIIGGYAAWVDTWGAPRFGPGPLVRTHEGQDVFCDYGDPVLASEAGTVEFDDGGLGGRVARLHRDDGSYWYYAHLSDWNTEQLSSGDPVVAGDVIGYCGNSGNAATTPPHVHFGWYRPNGAAKDPMRSLIGWLRIAEARALGLEAKTTGKRVAEIDRLTDERLFGDAFAPDRSELRVAGESLWASGSSPETAAFALAEAALQEALSRSAFAQELPVEPVALAAGTGVEGALDPQSLLADILAPHAHEHPEVAD